MGLFNMNYLAPPSTHYRLSLSELREVGRLQMQGYSIGEVAEIFEITVFEMERQAGIVRPLNGHRIEYRGVWRDPSTLQVAA